MRFHIRSIVCLTVRHKSGIYASPLAVKRLVRHICGMTREDPILRLRIPEELRAKLKAVAQANRRSMNAEIVDRLLKAFGGNENSNLTKEPSDALTNIDARLARVESAIVAAGFGNALVPNFSQDLTPLEHQQIRRKRNIKVRN